MSTSATNEIVLQNSTSDYLASLFKAALGSLPVVGPLLTEIVGHIIPQQRIDRLTRFASELEARLSGLEQHRVKQQLSNENFTDLIEESLRQAARSLSDERRSYIASLVANSIASEDIEFIESKHLLRILGEINDIEVIWLRSYLNPSLGGDEVFWDKHSHILNTVSAYMGAPQGTIDKSTIQISYKEHLASIGLLEREVEINTSKQGTKLNIKGYKLSPLGRLLLRELGFLTES